MTKDDITKLPTPEITLIFEKSRFCPSGNKSCWEDYSKLERHARSLEQRLAAAVMELREFESLSVGPAGYCSFPIGDQLRKARETLAAIKELSK